jgi:hypothetical protein
MTMSSLPGSERDLEEHRTPPDLARMPAMSVLALTARDFNWKAAAR